MVKKVSYNLRIPTNLIKAENKGLAINELGDYLIEQTLSDVGSARSPVDGKRFKGLSKEYKKEKRQVASPIANLELTGDMLDALKATPKKNGLEIGIFDGDEVGKADNHNKFSVKSQATKVPRRQFIPKKKGRRDFYRAGIKKEVIQILKENAKEGVTKKKLQEQLEKLNGL